MFEELAFLGEGYLGYFIGYHILPLNKHSELSCQKYFIR